MAIYTRVSTLDKGQAPEIQLVQLRVYVERRGFLLINEFIDYASSKNENREAYK